MAYRSYHLDQRSIWFDEATSWRKAEAAIPDLFRMVANDVHVPFYFLALKGWIACCGDSLYSLRMFSVVFSALTLVGICLLACELYGREKGCGSGSLGPRSPPPVGIRPNWLGRRGCIR